MWKVNLYVVKPAGTENDKYFIIDRWNLYIFVTRKSQQKKHTNSLEKPTLFIPLPCVHRASADYKPQSYNIIAYVYVYLLNIKACFRHWAIPHWKNYCLAVTLEKQTLEQTLHWAVLYNISSDLWLEELSFGDHHNVTKLHHNVFTCALLTRYWYLTDKRLWIKTMSVPPARRVLPPCLNDTVFIFIAVRFPWQPLRKGDCGSINPHIPTLTWMVMQSNPSFRDVVV